jgi:hypothetical protein
MTVDRRAVLLRNAAFNPPASADSIGFTTPIRFS